MAKVRIKIPNDLQILILYKSAKTCAVCKSKESLHIHHIDQNPSNNVEENLIVLCIECHDQAHTKHDLSINLNEKRLIEFKNKWEEEVAEKSKLAMTFNQNSSMINWAYFNFSQLPKYIRTHSINYKDRYYSYLISKNIINDLAELVVNDFANEHDIYRTVFNSVELMDSHSIKQYYENMVNQLISKINPYELDAIWTKREIKSLLKEGDFIFFMNGMYFKKVNLSDKRETRKIYMKSGKIRIEGFIYTQYMFGDSSLFCSFKGHKIVTGFYFIKSISEELSYITIHVTPLALGSGNYIYKEKTPYVLRDK